MKAFEEAIHDPLHVLYDGTNNIQIIDRWGNEFDVFMDCGEPDLLNHLIIDGEKFDFFKEDWGESARFMMTNNMIDYHSARLLELARASPNWDYD